MVASASNVTEMKTAKKHVVRGMRKDAAVAVVAAVVVAEAVMKVVSAMSVTTAMTVVVVAVSHVVTEMSKQLLIPMSHPMCQWKRACVALK
jgi:hypothetical protein